MAEANGNPSVPELLFLTTLTVLSVHPDTSGITREVHVLGTHATLSAAKAFACSSLLNLGYQPSDFVEYATRLATPAESWTYGDKIMVYAMGRGRHEFLVGIETIPNTESLHAGPNDMLVMPAGGDDLHYVLQDRAHYKQDRNGAYQTTKILGCYARRADALAAAKAVLEEDREEFAQYDERDDGDLNGEWPFGKEVVVHAVAQTGENYTVAVKTGTEARKKHGKMELGTQNTERE
ncbi:hypothetical protein BT67DRAFT_94163 [Trichocladium antarcticum]|uniref:Uncharacterized protein n=1 Tax=Trichocladium antarcticum TaxID=1450529 RepID=A0AAN6UFU1_9PEZI|nr:hypothetical protein BT67DRAFT_94163 [Trichocladium antarcticum]